MPVASHKELFVHELGDIYDAEQRIAQILPVMAQEAQDPQVKQALTQHADETKQQITNIEQCFKVLGVQPKGSACLAIDGLKKEHDNFVREQPSPDILTMYDLGAAEKTEHYEIASYRGLIDAAKTMGQQQCAQLLRQNLEQEEAMAKKVEHFAHTLGQQMASQNGQSMKSSDKQKSNDKQ